MGINKHEKYFNQKVVLITGASSGIGAELAKQISFFGANLALAARTKAKLSSLSQELGCDPKRILICQTDVQDSTQVKALIQATLTQFGRIDILINNAGVGQFGSFEAGAMHEMRQLMETNYWGALYACKEVIPVMKTQQEGVIVNITSTSSIHGQADLTLYCSSKAALHSFSQGLRMELAESRIKVIEIQPGVIDNGFHENALGQERHLYRQKAIRGASNVSLVRQILKAMVCGKNELVYPKYWKVYKFFDGLFPLMTEKVMTHLLIPRLKKSQN